MKKKILSLLLVMAMLLSIVPMAGAAGEVAEPKFTGYNLYLQNDISISFIANRAAIEEGFEKVEFYMGEELVQTRTTLPEADEDGNVAFRCTKLTPAQMGETVTAKLYIGGEVKHEFSTSIKDYCMTILRNESNTEAWKNAELRTMLVDLLNYGAATQTFAEATTPLVNADLGEYAALATTGNLSLENVCDVFEYTDLTAPTVTWYGVGLNLKDSVTLRYEFVAESVEGLAIHFFNDGYTLDAWVTDFEKVEGTEDHYYAYFGMLNPAQLSETISAVAYSAYDTEDSKKESHKLLYSAESYAYAVANGTGYSAELKALTDAMMRYGNAVRCWHNGHVYVYGRCESCDKEKIFAMTTDTITIQAEDAILNMTGPNNSDRIMENPNASGGKIVKMQAAYSAYADKTAGDYEGSIIVKFIPALSGTYTVSARAIDNGGALGGMVAAEDDVTTKYTRQGITETSKPNLSYEQFATTDLFVSGPIGSSYEFTAGKTYAIRILSTSANMAFDEFVITHVHTYDANGKCTGCGEAKTFKTQNGSVTIEAEEGILAAAGTENVITGYTDAPATVKNNTAASAGSTLYFNKNHSNYYALSINQTTDGELPVAHAFYNVTADVTGEHYIWLKVYTPNKFTSGAGDAVYCWIDGVDADGETTDTYFWRQPIAKADGTYSQNTSDFYWVRVYQRFNSTVQNGEDKAYNWTAGETYTLRFRGYAAQVQIDQIYITNSATDIPS